MSSLLTIQQLVREGGRDGEEGREGGKKMGEGRGIERGAEREKKEGERGLGMEGGEVHT